MKSVYYEKIISLTFVLMSLQTFAAVSNSQGKGASAFTLGPNRKVENDFFGFVILTLGNEWEKEWNTSPDTVPHFNEVEKVSLGQELSVLTLFANPKPDANNNFNVVCGIKITGPDKVVAVSRNGIQCLSGQLQGPAQNVRLSPGILKFVAEKSDPLGTWLIEVTIEDKNRKTKLELKTQFNYVDQKG